MIQRSSAFLRQRAAIVALCVVLPVTVYPARADGPSVRPLSFGQLAQNEAKHMNDTTERGQHFVMSGAGGSLSVDCEPGGKCVVIKSAEGATRGTRWTFDYVPSEWKEDPTAFESFPAFKGATSEDVDVAPVTTSTESHVGTANDRPNAHGTVSPVAPPPPVPQSRR